MTTAKEEMVDIISRQPDDSSYDALLRELAYARMVHRGLQDAAEGRVRSDAEVKKTIDSCTNQLQTGTCERSSLATTGFRIS